MLILIRRFYSPDPQPGGDPAPQPADPKPSDPKPGDEKSKVDIAKAYAELKKNSVSREDYDKVVKENEDLIKSVIDGEGGYGNGQDPQPKPKADIKALREELYGAKCSELSNLEFCQKTLELRDAVIEQEGYDPFLPYGSKIKPSEDDTKAANNVAAVMRECIEESEGNSEVFTALLQSRTNNDSPAFLAKMRKAGH